MIELPPRFLGRVPFVLTAVAVATAMLFFPHATTQLRLTSEALAGDTLGFTRQVSPDSQTNATEPSVAIDRSDGTVYVAWQPGGRHVARSDHAGPTFVGTPI